MSEEKPVEGQPTAAPPSGGGFWKGFIVGGIVVGVVVWVVTAFAYYHPKLVGEKIRADNAESQATMQANLLSNMRRQLKDAREAASRAQDAGRVFAEVIQQLDQAFKDLGLQTEEAASEAEGETAAPAEAGQGPETPAEEAGQKASAEKGQESPPSVGKAQTPPEAPAGAGEAKAPDKPGTSGEAQAPPEAGD